MSQPDDDIMLGLSSPRASGFSSHMPSYFQAPPRIIPVQPSIESSTSNAFARANLRSQLGFSSNNHRSAADLHAAHQADEVRLPGPAPKRSASPPIIMPPSEDEPDLSDALMSPRATEFTNNPFHEALAPTPPVQHTATFAPLAASQPFRGGSESREATPKPQDPRSPPLKGSSPINRNILEVLEST